MLKRALLAASAIVAASRIPAQEVRQQNQTMLFPSSTPTELWNRSIGMAVSTGVGGFAHAKHHGMTAEAYGRELGEIYAATWAVDSVKVSQVARFIQNHFRTLGADVSVVNATDTSITSRVTRSWRALFGASQMLYGVRLGEYDTVLAATLTSFTRKVGLRYDEQLDSTYLTMTVSGKSKYGIEKLQSGTYAVSFPNEAVKDNPDLSGRWEATFSPTGRFALTKDGVPRTETRYDVWLDQITFGSCSPNLPQCEPQKCQSLGVYSWFMHYRTKVLTLAAYPGTESCSPRNKLPSVMTLKMK